MEINEALSALQGRESFALAQGREDLLDEIDAERRRVLGLADTATTAEVTHAEQDAMQRGGTHIGGAE
jgi:hypothetical protein